MQPKPKASNYKRYVEEDTRFYGKYSKSVFETVWFSFRPLMRRVIFLLLLGLVARFSLLSTANIMGYWADSFCQGMHCTAVPSWLNGYSHQDYVQLLLATTVIGFVLNGFFRVFISRTSCLAASSLYDEVTFRTSRLPISFFDRTPVGRIISRFSSDYGNIFRMLGGPMGEFLSVLFDLILMFVLTAFASPYYIPVLLASIALNYGLYKLNQSRLRSQRRELSVVRAPSIAHFSESVQGYRVIKVFGREFTFAARFSEFVDRYLTERMKTVFAVNFFAWQMTTLTLILLLMTGILGVYLVRSGAGTLGSVAVAFTFVTMACTSLQQFFEFVASLEEALTGIERLNEYLRKEMEPGALLPVHATFPTGHPKESQGHAPQNALRQRQSAALEVRNLSLRYQPHLPPVLKQVSFSVPAGGRVGIVGHTGAGKSSLIQALFHLYPFESGNILMDGFEADLGSNKAGKTVPLKEFRQAIGYIPQEPVLFRAKLRENISLDSAIPDEQLIAVLVSVGLEDWLATLGESPLDYVIEERGANLSAGQRQLVCMARCVLQRNPIVLMDEATSAVDPATEEKVVNALETTLHTRTQLIVAHRLSTVERCDEIVWLQNGQIVMKDTPSEVLRKFA